MTLSLPDQALQGLAEIAEVTGSKAGADILFVDAIETAEDIRALPQWLSSQQLMNMVIGGMTPHRRSAETGYGGSGTQ